MPQRQSIYHITHLNNLSSILKAGGLWSDREILKRGGAKVVIGMNTIKSRRLEELKVGCHPGTFVGDYVPFYFCPRSVMLYVIMKRCDELEYKGGQDQIVHLESTIGDALRCASSQLWAFSDGNAGANYTEFSNNLDNFGRLVDMTAVNAIRWSDPAIKPKKQAEFLVHGSFPWIGFRNIGVKDHTIAKQVQIVLNDSPHKPQVLVRPSWYY